MAFVMLNEVKHLANEREARDALAACVPFPARILRFAQDDKTKRLAGVPEPYRESWGCTAV